MGFGIFATLGAVAAARDEMWMVPNAAVTAVVSAGVGIGALFTILQVERRGSAAQPALNGAGKRVFLRVTGVFVAVTVLGSATAHVLTAVAGEEVARDREQVVLPRAWDSVPDPTSESSLVVALLVTPDAERLTPIVTPMEYFYRVDTALAVPVIDLATW